MKQLYKMKKLDIFKDGVSLPGLVLKYLMRGTDSEFSLFSEEDKIFEKDYNEYFDDDDSLIKTKLKRNNLFYLLKDSIVGGPSIIFNRYHESNKTYIEMVVNYVKK